MSTAVFCASSSSSLSRSSSSGSRNVPPSSNGVRLGDLWASGRPSSGKYDTWRGVPDEGVNGPSSFFDAMLSARVNALPRWGDTDAGSACRFGGGGKAVFAEGPGLGGLSCACRKMPGSRLSEVGELEVLRSAGGRRRAVVAAISARVE